MRKFSCCLATSVAAVALTAGSASAQDLTAEVIHWWTSGGESQAIAVIADEFEARGGTWIDTAIVGGSNARAAVLNRILGGDPPTAMQWNIGIDVIEIAEQGLLNDLSAMADAEGWLDVLPPLIVDHAVIDGDFYAVPLNIHADNWMWYSTEIYDELGLAAPTTWDEFLQQAEVIQEAGYIPLALGGQPWQERILFSSVLVDIGGNDLYRSLFVNHEPSAARDGRLTEVFETFRALGAYVDEGSPGRNWNDATNMVMTGRAAVQIMGDWAKGEFAAAGLVPGEDYGCAISPGNQSSYVLVVDVFTFARTDDADQLAAQEMLAGVMMDPEVQVAFNAIKGSVPARLDAPVGELDMCAQIGAGILADRANHLPTFNMAMSGDLGGSIEDAITQFWNTPSLSAEDGAELIAQTLEQAF